MFDNNSIDDSLDFLDDIDILKGGNLDGLFGFDEEKTEQEEPVNEPENEPEEEPEVEPEEDPEEEPENEPEEEPEEDSDEEPKKPRKRRFLGSLIYFIFCIAFAFALSFVISKFVIHNTIVRGSSMEPTLSNNDMILIDKLAYVIGEPARYDMVVFAYDQESDFIKRIIALPGETVQITNGIVYVNGFKLDSDTYGKESIKNAGSAAEPITLGDNEYFVLGDNRNNSVDSRKDSVGKVKRSEIDGRAVFRLYPFSKMGLLQK